MAVLTRALPVWALKSKLGRAPWLLYNSDVILFFPNHEWRIVWKVICLSGGFPTVLLDEIFAGETN